MRGMQKSGIVLTATAALLLAGCSEVDLISYGAKKYHARHTPTATANSGVDRGTPKIGKPYQVDGVWYYPAADEGYDETGIASWYGEPFHGRPTANGAIYDMNQLTAAHKTLPLPTDVRVTNLENGRSIIVTVNDRGPFVHSRIIDLSYKAATLLGFAKQGTAKVRVQVVHDGTPNGDKMIIAQPRITDEEKNNVAAAPQKIVVADALEPPSGASSVRPKAEALPEPKVSSAGGPVLKTASVALPDTATSKSDMVTVQPVGDSEIFIQAGAFVDYNNANILSARLSALGPTKVSQALVNGQDFYRVRIGPVETTEEADQLLENLINTGHKDARIIIE